MEVYDMEIYGPHMKDPQGWIIELGEDAYYHRFGGDTWSTMDFKNICEKPVLLITLDLRDPKLISLRVPALDELPLCYSINCDTLLRKQALQIQPASRTVTLLDLDADSPEPFNAEDLFHNPLPERRVKLRAMGVDDYPVDEDVYEKACEQFIGGASFIRVLGPPLWLQWVEEEICTCGLLMTYVCSIGYEDINNPTGFIPDRPFFIGEAALYFFLCRSCLKTIVTSQPT